MYKINTWKGEYDSAVILLSPVIFLSPTPWPDLSFGMWFRQELFFSFFLYITFIMIMMMMMMMMIIIM